MDREEQQNIFLTGLQMWVDEVEGIYRELRQQAMRQIVVAKNQASTELSLSALLLSSLPQQIGELTALRKLDLAANNLTTLPAEITNLTALEELDLQGNQFTTIPQEIGRLSSLKILNLNQNQITSVPTELGNLNGLQRLLLSDNQLTTYPEFLLNHPRNVQLQIHTAGNTMINVSERLRSLAIGNNILLYHSSQDYMNDIIPEPYIPIGDSFGISASSEEFPHVAEVVSSNQANLQQQNTILVTDQVISKAPSEERGEELRVFLQSSDLANFNRFLSECPRTEAWKSHQDEMIQCLFEIVSKMSKSAAVKVKSEAIASTAFDTCGDRVGLAFVQMQLAVNLPDKEVAKMSAEEVYDYARQESVIKFLGEKAEDKIKQIKSTGRAVDEIETYLAYLQIGKDLGLNLQANGMLYPRCSNVSDAELQETKTEFMVSGSERKAFEHLYNDTELQKHPVIQKIITEVSGRKEFDTELREEEKEGAYLERFNEIKKQVAAATISEITATIQKELKGKSAASTGRPAGSSSSRIEQGAGQAAGAGAPPSSSSSSAEAVQLQEQESRSAESTSR